MAFMRRCCLFLLLFISLSIFSQTDYGWWNQKHQWDGKTSWIQYLKYSSKYFGPNALPVPENIKGTAGDISFIELNSAIHLSKGDKTQDGGYNVAFNLFKNYVTVQVFGTLVEHYKMDTITLDERACRNFSGEGYAMGDVNISTIIQIVRESNFPDVAVRANLRTASGGKIEDARYTDAPGYYFDLSMGKTLILNSKCFDKIRIYGYGGFYCWENHYVEKRQDDAYMYSLGFDLIRSQNLLFSNEIAGYSGADYNGDKPLIYRTSLKYKSSNRLFYIQYYRGFRDYTYQSIRVGLQFLFNLPAPKSVAQ